MCKKMFLKSKQKSALKKALSVFVAVSVTVCSGVFSVSASEDYLTRGEVCDMLLNAADDYNPGVQKSDILRGYEDGDLHEEQNVTRVEALVMLKRAFGEIPEIRGDNKYIALPKEDFTDVPQWAEEELEEVFDAGVVSGKEDGIFAPYDNVTAEEMQLIIKRMYRVFGTNLKDDFYASVNKDELDNLVIKDGKYAEGNLVSDVVENNIEDLIKEVASSNPEKNSKADKIKILYNNYLNTEERNEQGYEPLKESLENIDNIKNVSEFTSTMALGAPVAVVFMEFGIGFDTDDTSHYADTFYTISIQSKDMYEGQLDTQKNAYLKLIKNLFMLEGKSEAEATKIADDIFAFEKEVAEASIDVADQYNVDLINNKYSLEELDDIFKTVDLEEFFDYTGMKNKDKFIVNDVGAMEKVAELLNDENIDVLKNYSKFKLLKTYARYLSDDFRDVAFTFNAEMTGADGKLSDEYYAMDTVTSMLQDYVGELYADKYVTESMRENFTQMVYDIIGTYRERITNLDWMSDATKEKAIKKLDAINVHALAPTEWAESTLDGEEIRSYEDGGNLIENIVTIDSAKMKDLYALEGTSVDRNKWITSPQIKNSFYYDELNCIELPIADQQLPYAYSEDASYEENLGGAGWVIGHEISHAFDSGGSQYDENGNAVNWWTDEDAEAFEKLCDNVVEFYRGQEGVPGVEFNPEQTITEDIADLGALSVITELASKTEGFDYDKMYRNMAKAWCETMTREVAEYYAAYDTHSYSSVRINRSLQSSDKFFETYGITENDGMWVAPEDRPHIW